MESENNHHTNFRVIPDSEVKDRDLKPFGAIIIDYGTITLRTDPNKHIYATETPIAEADKRINEVGSEAVLELDKISTGNLYLRQVYLGNSDVKTYHRFSPFSERHLNFFARSIYDHDTSRLNTDSMTFGFLHQLVLPQSVGDKDQADFVVFNPKRQSSIAGIKLVDNGEITIWFVQPSGEDFPGSKDLATSHLGLYELLYRIEKELLKNPSPAIQLISKVVDKNKNKIVTPYDNSAEGISFSSLLRQLWELQAIVEAHHLELQGYKLNEIKKNPNMLKLVPWLNKSASNLWGFLNYGEKLLTEDDWKVLLYQREKAKVIAVTEDEVQKINRRLDKIASSDNYQPRNYRPGREEDYSKLEISTTNYTSYRDLKEWERQAMEKLRINKVTRYLYTQFRGIFDIADSVHPRYLRGFGDTTNEEMVQMEEYLTNLLDVGIIDNLYSRPDFKGPVKAFTPMPDESLIKDFANNTFSLGGKLGGDIIQGLGLTGISNYETAIKRAASLLKHSADMEAEIKMYGGAIFDPDSLQKEALKISEKILTSGRNEINNPTLLDSIFFLKLSALKSLSFLCYLKFIYSVNNDYYLSSGKHTQALSDLRIALIQVNNILRNN